MTTTSTISGLNGKTTAYLSDAPSPPEKPVLTPTARFAAAVVAVMSSASYPLAGHILTELEESAAEISQPMSLDLLPGEAVGFDGASFAELIGEKTDELIAAARVELNAEAKRLVDSLNENLSAAVASTLAEIKTAGDAQLAAIQAASATPAAKAAAVK